MMKTSNTRRRASMLWLRMHAFASITVLAMGTAASAQGTSGAPAVAVSGPRAVGVNILHLNVTDLDKSLAFYRDALGMEPTAPLAPARPGGGLVSEPGAMLRTVILRVPGGSFSFELVEWTGVPLRPHKPRIQDPGQIMLAMNVRDLDAKLTAAKKLGLHVLTKGGEPFVTEGRNGARNRAVMIQDPTGFVVELVDNPGAPNTGTDSGTGAITSVAVYVTVQDLAQTVAFYNKAFGFTMPEPPAVNATSERVKALFDNPSLATMRTARGTFPGSDFSINFQEFAGVDRKPARHRVQDPGGPIFLVQVQEFPAVIELVRAHGGIIGPGESSVALAPDARSSWVRDPNGVLLQLSVPRPPRAGGPAAVSPAPAPAPRP